MRTKLTAALVLWALCAMAADSAKVRIGVFDTKAAAGSGGRVDGMVRGLKRHGYDVDKITDLQMITLLQYDIIFLCDMHNPGRVNTDWRKTLKRFVADGGSVLQTWHHHVLGEVGVGIKRIYGSRHMHIVPGHPAVAGCRDFDAVFRDHIIERVGKGATVIMRNDDGQPVAVAGKIGKGKVISTGLALAMPRGNSTSQPRGAELKLLEAFLAWLAPDVPRAERLAAALKTPSLYASPTEAMTAAGFSASFEVRVAGPGADHAQVTCDGAEVTPKPADQLPEALRGSVAAFDIVVPTEPGKDIERELTVQAVIGGKTLAQEIKVKSVYGPTPPNERRGVWLHVGMDRQPKDVMPELKKLGINMVVLRIAGGTAAFYASKVQPDIQDPLAPNGDWLAEAVKYAHANGIEIHPYVNCCIVTGRTSKETFDKLRAAGRLQQDPKGNTIGWFCPSQEANIEAMERVMVEIASKYDVDGIQYDFIRYPGPQGCFCPKCRALFEKETGKPVANWPADVIEGNRHEEWVQFRARRISELVKRISTHIRKVAPKVKISAAVFTRWPGCIEGNGQDWGRWCREGWLDFVCPMNYTLDPEDFVKCAASHREAVGQGFPIAEGIGINSGSGAMHTPEQLAAHIALARKSGAIGWVGFCYRPKQTTKLFAPLKDWIEAKP